MGRGGAAITAAPPLKGFFLAEGGKFRLTLGAVIAVGIDDAPRMDKAGDNQSLTTYAETLKGDHEANQEAVKALSTQKNVKLESVPSEVDQKVRALDKLDGGAFNTAFLRDEVIDHEKALSSFKSARSKFKEDPHVELYIDQTIPILKAHLDMAKNLESQVGINTDENPANNKKQ